MTWTNIIALYHHTRRNTVHMMIKMGPRQGVIGPPGPVDRAGGSVPERWSVIHQLRHRREADINAGRGWRSRIASSPAC